MKVFLGADHAGFDFKEKLKKSLEKRKVPYDDCGAYALSPEDDYPDYAFIVGHHVAHTLGSMGILICGSATGMAIAANKVPGIRAAACHDLYTAKMSREHNNANVLCVPARKITYAQVDKIVNTWMKSKFSADARHRRRVNKIAAYEAQQ